VCPDQVHACEVAFAAIGRDWDSFAEDFQADSFDDVSDENEVETAVVAWENLAEAFDVATAVGDSRLTLEIGYFSAEQGDGYGDLDVGCFFVVHGARTFTPAAESIREHLNEKSWSELAE
jgi:hypothetical protein